MKTFYSLLLVLLASMFIAGCNDDDPATPPPSGGSGGSDGGGGDAGGDETTTTFSLAVEVPDGVAVAMNDPFNPLGWMLDTAVAEDVAVEDLDLGNFEVRLYDPDGDGLDGDDDYEVVDSSLLELTDLGDGNYELSVPGEPRLDCVIVTILTVTGSGEGGTLELQVPTVRDPAVNSEPLRLNYASTAATRQYITTAVETGGFDSELSVEEVDALIEEVAEQVASVPLPEGIDLGNPDEVFAALDASAKDLVKAQIEIATSNPESGSLEAFAGNYYASFLSRSVFGTDQETYLEHEFTFEDFNNIELVEGFYTANFAGIPLTVNESEKTATFVIDDVVERSFGATFANNGNGFSRVDYAEEEPILDDSEEVSAKILANGALIVDPGTGQISGGFLDAPNSNYYAEINNTTSFRLKPWGEAYVGSALFRFTEYWLNNPEASCLADLGLTEDDFANLDEDGVNDLITGLEAGSSAIIAAECDHNAVMHELLSVTMAKKGDVTLDATDLEGAWGIVGTFASFPRDRGSFSSVFTFDANGGFGESSYLDTGAYVGSGSLVFEAYTDAVESASASISEDGILAIDWGEDGTDLGYVSSDLGLMYIGGADATLTEDSLQESEIYQAYGVPLTTGITADDLDGKTFDFVGLQMSLEREATDSGVRLSSNHDSVAGLTMSFANTVDGLEVTLGGDTDLGILDMFYSQGLTGFASEIEYNDPASGTIPVESIADNGLFEIRLQDSDGEDLIVRGFYDRNGRIAMALASVTAGGYAAVEAAETGEQQFGDVTNGIDFTNFGYMLGTCKSGCSAQ